MPPSGVMNSYSTLPSPGDIASDVPSLPCTLSALIVALGKVNVDALGCTVRSRIILPKAPDGGKFKKLNVVDAVIVAV